jgi:hypothetical protein
MNNEVINRVREIQASMLESARPHFDKSELDDLRVVIRLTVEFHDYLENGSVDIAMGLLNGPLAKYVTDARSASTDPFNKYDLQFACDSVRSGVKCFFSLSERYHRLGGSVGSRVEWGMISSRESFKASFVSMFREFSAEANFENKCRLLLDLFKLQIIFVGVCYD